MDLSTSEIFVHLMIAVFPLKRVLRVGLNLLRKFKSKYSSQLVSIYGKVCILPKIRRIETKY
ncbi:MAG: hypothetical protein ACK5CR_23750, partial [Pseudanabaena sp.]